MYYRPNHYSCIIDYYRQWQYTAELYARIAKALQGEIYSVSVKVIQGNRAANLRWIVNGKDRVWKDLYILVYQKS